MLQDQSLRTAGGPHSRVLANGVQGAVAPAIPVRRSSALLSVAQCLRTILAAVKGRQALTRLAEFDDRLLADIGITPHDLSDARGSPLSCDPTTLLARRASDRRQALQGIALRAAGEEIARLRSNL